MMRVPPAVLGAAIATLTLPAAGAWMLYRASDAVSDTLASSAGAAIFVLAATFATGLALLPTWIASVLAGYAFGLGLGLPAAIAAITAGSAVGYAVARTLAHQRVESLIARQPRWQAVRQALVGGGFWRTLGIVALVRVPTHPFAATNLLAAAVGTPPAAFVLATALGLLPRTAVAVYTGSRLDSFAAAATASSSFPWLTAAGLAAAFLALLVVVCISRRALARLTATPA